MNLGYACINMTLAEKGITTNRGMIKRTFGEKGIQYASQLALQNVQALQDILKWNIAQGIRVFRITSELFPWASEYQLADMPDFKEIQGILKQCGQLPIRVSTHPGPFNKLAGSDATLANTIKELEVHSQLFDLMELEPSHWNKINIHVGGTYGDKGETLKRFAQNFKSLSSNLQRRLTVENDDKQGLYTVAELHPLYESIGIPIVFDYFHHKLHPGLQSEEEAFYMAYQTWGETRPVFHYSSSRRENEEPSAKREAHADYIYEPINTYGKEVDIVLEAKKKEQALLKYREQFGDI
ncbi:UV DNA damage repair endonuclease UvsE [Flavisolibacter tropicus]|uniref:UV damage repair endonuclease UvdE n=1 Tax=Flavisolibacter tropicus TaxID=1492898 RepID=A0A172TTZ3_9BACT|nr:UV DNA damage repair endonuclease UvsE [Flavisolibacter tropicus]ANE50565.1 UV damage repair endonuclease UvdE [Flavisolibacter tropicus]